MICLECSSIFPLMAAAAAFCWCLIHESALLLTTYQNRLWMAMNGYDLNTFEAQICLVSGSFWTFRRTQAGCLRHALDSDICCPLGCLGNHGISTPTPGLGFSTSLCRSLSEIMQRSKRLKTADNQQSNQSKTALREHPCFVLSQEVAYREIYENIMSSCNHIVILNVIHFSTSQAFLMIFPMDFSHGKFRPSPRSPRSPSLRARPEYVLKKTAPGLLAWQGDRIQPVEVATFPAEVHHGKIQQLPWPLINVEPGLVNLQKTMERYGKSTAFWMGTSTNYITMFNSVLYVYQRVYAWEINALNNVNPRLINL